MVRLASLWACRLVGRVADSLQYIPKLVNITGFSTSVVMMRIKDISEQKVSSIGLGRLGVKMKKAPCRGILHTTRPYPNGQIPET